MQFALSDHISMICYAHLVDAESSTAIVTGVGFGDHCAFIYTAEMAPPRQGLVSICIDKANLADSWQATVSC